MIALAACGGDDGESPLSAPSHRVASTCALEAPSLATGRLATAGTRLLDERGRVVLLRGVAAGSRAKFAPYLPFDVPASGAIEPAMGAFFDQLASWGIDVVRLSFSWEALEPTEGHDDEAYLARYEAMIDAAWARGMRVVVDFHQDVYASPFGGDGFPPWTLGPIPHGAPTHDDAGWFMGYADAKGPVVAAFERFWTNADGIQDAYVAAWTRLARRLAKRPGIAGFELLNEPGWGNGGRVDMEQRLLVPLVDRVGAAVRAEAPGVPIFQGGSGQNAVEGTSHVPDTKLEGFVWAPHRYDAIVQIGGTYTGAEASRAATEALARVGLDRGHPVFFGELGAPNRAQAQREFVRDTFDVLDRLGAHGTLWEASRSTETWNREDFSAMDASGAEKPIVDVLVRGYPRAVDGTIDAFAWDADGRTLELRVSSAGGGVSEIFVPPRHVGALPAITVEGGCFSWDGATGRLLVKASAPSVTVRVAP
jgi:endoglycosylceramidase